MRMFFNVYKNIAKFFRVSETSIKQCNYDHYSKIEDKNLVLINSMMLGTLVGFSAWGYDDISARRKARINNTELKTFPINGQSVKTKEAKNLVDLANGTFSMAGGASLGLASYGLFEMALKYKKTFDKAMVPIKENVHRVVCHDQPSVGYKLGHSDQNTPSENSLGLEELHERRIKMFSLLKYD